MIGERWRVSQSVVQRTPGSLGRREMCEDAAGGAVGGESPSYICGVVTRPPAADRATYGQQDARLLWRINAILTHKTPIHRSSLGHPHVSVRSGPAGGNL